MRYRRQDTVYRRAKAEGYRARSAYKLAELDDRFHLLRRGARVVDLGAWPGGWLQVALERVGPGGRLVGVDLEALSPFDAPNVRVLCGDVRDPDTIAAVREAIGGPADVVLSDLAPKLSGVREADAARCEGLLSAVVSALPELLGPGGALVVKIFMSETHQDTIRRLSAFFARVRSTRVASTRRGSAELYAVAQDFHGGCA